jgi:hypothetical protein
MVQSKHSELAHQQARDVHGPEQKPNERDMLSQAYNRRSAM